MHDANDNPRTALVTGSARRVGRAIAARLCADGWNVATHSRSLGSATEAAKAIGAAGGIGADLEYPEACSRAIDDACSLLGGLDLLVCNASSFVRKQPGAITAADWDAAMNVTARAPMLMMQAAFAALAESPTGCVVLISDRSAREHWVEYAAHAAATAALESLCLSHAAAWNGRVRVNAVQPGMIMAPDDWDDAQLTPAARADQAADLQRMIEAILHLAGDQHTTGNIIVL